MLISALGWKGEEHELLRRVFRRELEIIISPDIMAEFRDVVRRRKLNLPTAYVDSFEEQLLRVATLVVPEVKIDVVKEDSEDNKVLECAAAGKADFIVSGDRHLLKLAKYGGTRIVRASLLLRTLQID